MGVALLFRYAVYGGLLALVSGAAHAQSPVGTSTLTQVVAADTAFVLLAAVVAFAAILPGFALYFGGKLRSFNRVSLFAQIGAIVAVVSVLWAITGYTLAFGYPDGGIIGLGNAWMLIMLAGERNGTLIPESAFVWLQLVAALVPLTLMAGMWAERARFLWVVAFAGLWSLLVYAPVAHWVWGGGFLLTRFGVLDHAGGLVMLTTAGVSGTVAIILIGRRREREGELEPVMNAGGASLVYVGLLALIAGQSLAATDDAAAAMLNAHLSAATCTLCWFIMEKLLTRHASPTGWSSAMLAGVAACAAPAGYISPGGAMLIGLIAAPIAYFAPRFYRLDDAGRVCPQIALPAMVGVLLTGIFVSPTLGGTGFSEGMGLASQITAQVVGLIVVSAWSAIGSAIAALMASVVFPMRVSAREEATGLDIPLLEEHISDES